MKTSNKLLITLAVSLIVIPIVVIAINIKVNYRDKKTFFKQLEENNDFNFPLSGFLKKELIAFSAINFVDGNDVHINVEVIKSKKSGIKVPSELANTYDFSVDNKQTLQIKLKKPTKKMKHSITLYIYTSDINLLSISNAAGFTLKISTDSLNMEATHINRLSFDEKTNIKSLKLVSGAVENLNISDTKGIEHIDLVLKGSNFYTSNSAYESLKIHSSGKSNIDIYGDKIDKEKFKIGLLYIETKGSSSLNLENVKVGKSSGSLSDSTKVSMPVKVLRTMFTN